VLWWCEVGEDAEVVTGPDPGARLVEDETTVGDLQQRAVRSTADEDIIDTAPPL
jgi:hypothetical protein